MTNNIVDDQTWLDARIKLLELEKALTQQREAVAKARRQLPWRAVREDYVFEGPTGAFRLSELFGNRNQLIVYHFMFEPGWQEGCKHCSFWADQYDTLNLHIGQRDVALAVISKAPWQFTWLSSSNNKFNEDYQVSFDENGGVYNYAPTDIPGERPGLSVFTRDQEGNVFHTYSCYARGLDALNVTYQMLDLVPYGRNEADLSYPQAWVNFHDCYAD